MQQLIKILLRKRGLLSFLCISATFVLTLVPSSGQSELPAIPFMDKIAHVVLFASIAFALFIDVRAKQYNTKSVLIIASSIVIIGTLFGWGIEHLQTLVGRTKSLGDVAADVIGLLLGVLTALIVYVDFERRQWI